MRKTLKQILLVLFTLSAVGSSFEEDIQPTCSISKEFLERTCDIPIGRPLPWRVKRETSENIKEFLDRASSLARITNGISLQNGLLDEKIKIVSAAGELLNFGSVDITKISPNEIKGFASKITEVKENLIKLKNETAEKTLETVDEIRRRSEEVKQMDKIEGYDKYFDDVDGFLKLNLGEVNKFNRRSDNIISDLADLKLLDENSEAGTAFRDVEAFLSSFKTYKGYIPFVNNFQTQLQGFSHLNNASKIFQPFKSLIHSVKQRPSDSIVSLHQDIASFLELVALTVSSKTHTESVFNLLHSRGNPTISERKYTAGLPNGFTELSGLNQEIKNPLLESLLKRDFSKLLEGLKPIDSIQNDFGETDELFRGFSSSAFLDIHLLRDELLKNSLTKEEADSVLKLIEDRLSKPVPDTNATQTMLSNIDEFSKMVEALKAWADRVTGEELATAISEFDKLITFTDINNPTTSKAEVPAIIRALKEEDAISKLENAINKAQSMPPGYTTDNINTTANAIKKSDLDEFRNGQEVKDELKFHSDLRENKGLRKLMNSIETIKVIRSFDQNQMTQLTSLADTISKATKNLNGLKSVVSKMKTNVNSESDQLKKEDLIATSRTIGHAVSGLRKMYALAKTNLNYIDELVPRALNSLSDPQKKTELEKGWRSFTTSLATSIQKINELDSRIQLKKLKTISDFGSQFTDADTIPDVILPMDMFDDLIRNVQDPDVKANLKEERVLLEGFDLKFSDHHKAFKGSLVEFKSLEDSLNKFFDSEAKAKKPIFSKKFWRILGYLVVAAIPWYIFLFIVLLVCYYHPCCLLAKYLKEIEKKDRFLDELQPLLNNNEDEKKEEVHEEEKKKEVDEAAAIKQNDDEETETVEKPEEPKIADFLEDLDNSMQGYMDETLILEIGKTVPDCLVHLPGDLLFTRGEEVPGVPLNAQKMRSLRWLTKHTFKDAGTALAYIHTAMQKLTVQYAELVKPTLGKGDGAAARYETEMKLYRDEVSKRYEYLPESKHRNVNLLRNRNVRGLERNGKEVRIHSNMITATFGVEYIMTQGPIAADEGLKNQYENENPKDDTRADFWLMAFQKDVETIVMLCNFEETIMTKKNGKAEMVTKPVCGRYFSDNMKNPEIQCGEFKIKTLSEKKMFEGDNEPNVKVRKLQVTHRDGRSKNYNHFQITDWPEGSVPNYSPDKLWNIYKEIKKSTRKTMIAHCSNGTGRTMVYVGIYVLTDLVVMRAELDLGKVLKYLQPHRAIKTLTCSEAYYLLSGINYGVCMEANLKMEHYQKREDVRKHLMANNNMKDSPVWRELYKEDGDPKELDEGRKNFPF